MLLNERQFLITRTKVKEFESAIAELSSLIPSDDLNEELLDRATVAALESQLEEMREEVEEYEKLKAGKIDRLSLDSFARLPETLIKARIIRGWTQEQLAERLGVKAQQVQRDEANLYAGASFTKLLEILEALDIEVRGEVNFR